MWVCLQKTKVQEYFPKGKLYISIGKEDWHEENSGKKLRPEGD